MFPLPLILLSALVLLAAGRDLAERTIPNRFIGLALLCALGAHLLAGSPPWYPLAGLATGLLLFLPLYLAHGMGAGDVKLMAAVGTFAGPVLALQIALATCIAGGAVSLGFLTAPRANRHSTMPYAPSIAIGTLAVLAFTVKPA
ncbi:MAG TPA: A24 family peptidase [Telluria sp.]